MSSVTAVEFTVSVDFDQLAPVSMGQLEDVAGLGGVSVGNPGGTTVGATMTVEAGDALAAGRIGIDRVAALVGAGRVVGVEALRVEEFDRRFEIGLVV